MELKRERVVETDHGVSKSEDTRWSSLLPYSWYVRYSWQGTKGSEEVTLSAFNDLFTTRCLRSAYVLIETCDEWLTSFRVTPSPPDVSTDSARGFAEPTLVDVIQTRNLFVSPARSTLGLKTSTRDIT